MYIFIYIYIIPGARLCDHRQLGAGDVGVALRNLRPRACDREFRPQLCGAHRVGTLLPLLSLRPKDSTYVSALCVCVCRMCLSDMTEDLAATLLPFLALRLPFEFVSLARAGVNIITTGATHTHTHTPCMYRSSFSTSGSSYRS